MAYQPASTGIGLKAQHVDDVLTARPSLGFFEVHTENYMGAGGPPHRQLEAVRRDWDVSLHGVGLSLGSVDGLDADHLARVRVVADRYEPALVSEHVSWSFAEGRYLNDLVALPYTEEALDVICRNVDAFQNALGRSVLMENPSAYVSYQSTDMDEPTFLAELARRTGCGLLLDVNNVYVSAKNLGFDPFDYVSRLPLGAVGEIHLAGHHVRRDGGREIRIDDHGSAVSDAVWDLYRVATRRFGAVPTLVEWDTDVPALSVLVDEAAKADAVRAETEGTYHANVA